MTVLGLEAYGNRVHKSVSSAVRNVDQITLTDAVYDEVHLRERTDKNLTSTKTEWQVDTLLRGLFQNNLEAGNVQNDGMPIEKFVIKRRKTNDLKNIKVGEMDFNNNETVSFTDRTQTNDHYVYSIVPFSQDIEGKPNEVQIESDYTGWYVYDKDTDNILSFDTFIGSAPSVDTNLNQGRTQINTLSKFPTVFYTDQNFHEFQLQATFVPEEWERSGKDYQRVLDQFMNQHRPFLIKSGNGELYVCDVHAPNKSAPLNTWKGHDYFTLTINCTEIDDYETYMEG